ncbi:MAG: hypothetical protein AMJ53_13480 [Gammaproteobacteria bacterium SG8_11]|nr:MAG: hypothetical protein AMJ53_13480 [Gammaproteobacteria bacterium SG8_11]
MARTIVFFSGLNKFTIVTFLLIVMVAVMGGCNTGDESSNRRKADTGGTIPDPTPDPTPSPLPTPAPPPRPSVIPHTIKLSYKTDDAIEVQEGGFYSWQGGVIVTDANGHAVADGTEVSLAVIDTVIAQGGFGTLQAASGGADGNTITDPDPFFGNGENPNNLGLDSMYAVRNNAYRFIRSGDRVFLLNADEQDKDRTISAINATTLTVNRNYSQAYPNNIYDGTGPLGPTEYLVGISALGAEISGEDESGNSTMDKTFTRDGRATFRVTYPSSASVLNTGCGPAPFYDARSEPIGTPPSIGDPNDPTDDIPGVLGSARVYVVASVNENVVTVDDQFCFSPVAGFTVKAPEQVGGAPGESIMIYPTVKDGGDTVIVPYYPFDVSVINGDGAQVSVVTTSGVTNQYGEGTVTVLIGGTSGSTATLTITAEEGTAETTINIF